MRAHRQLAATPSATNLHGLFEPDDFRAAVVAEVARLRGVPFTSSPTSFVAARESQLDRLGDLVENHLDLPAIWRLIEHVR